MKKMKLSAKAVLSLVLSAVLFCMPGLGFAMNGNYAVSVHAEDTEPESSSEENRTENDTEQETESGSEENSTEEDTVSGGDVKEPECTCEDKCGAYEYDHNCEVCVKDYKLCAYKKPNVTIHVETVVLLSRKTPDDTIEVDLDLDELDITAAESKATYQEIKDYVLKEFGLKVSTLYISQIKRKCGIDVGEHYNISQKENQKVPQCPKEKEDAIRAALEHFAMI